MYVRQSAMRKGSNISNNSDAVPSRERSLSIGKVRFDEQQVSEHGGQISINLSPDGRHADAHLGFLQDKHKYELQLVMPVYLGDSVQLIQTKPNLHLKSVKADTAKTKHVLSLTLITEHHGIVNEELKLQCDNHPFVITISARILGQGSGTPLLKSGIRSLGTIEGYDSSTSDASSVANALH